MAANLLHTIVRYSIVVITAIVLILLTVNLVKELDRSSRMDAQTIIYVILAYLIYLFGLFGAWKEDFLYLIICGIGLICTIIFGFANGRVAHTENNVVTIVLTVLVFVFAIIVKRGGL